jgi:hypothetical protein
VCNENLLTECDRPEERRALPVGSIKDGRFREWQFLSCAVLLLTTDIQKLSIETSSIKSCPNIFIAKPGD